MKWFLILIAPLIVLSACQPQVGSSFDHESVVEDATEMLHDYHEAMNKDGLMAEVHYLDSSEQFFWVPPGEVTKMNYDKVMEVLAQASQDDRFMRFSWRDLYVDALSDDVAVYSGTVQFESINEHGDQYFSYILETGTLVKRFDGWKLLCGQSRTVHLP